MSAWYSLNGRVKVRHDDETRNPVYEIVDRYNNAGGAEMRAYLDDLEDGTAEITFEGGDYLRCGGALELDEIAQELSPYAVEPTFLDWDHDEGDGRLYVGPPECEADATSAETLKDIKALLPDLNARDRAALITQLESLKLEPAV